MTKAFHFFEVGSLDLICRSFAHLWRSAPVVLSSEEVYGTLAHVDLLYTIPGIEPTKVKVEVTMEDSCDSTTRSVLSRPNLLLSLD